MNPLALLVMVAYLPPAATFTEQGDSDQLRGMWKVVAARISGQGPLDGTEGIRLVITADTITVGVADQPWYELAYTLDPTREPKWIDLTYRDGGKLTLRGVYALEGDELRICFDRAGGERTAGISLSSNSCGDILMRLRRARP